MRGSLRDPATCIADVRSPWLFRLLVGWSVFVFAEVLYLTSYKSFYFDEWSFTESRRPWRLDLFLLPHNGHWSTIPILVWKVLFALVGLRSHIPYQAAALAVHVACVLLLFVLVRKRSGELPAIAAALTLLVLGKGAEDIVWAFQIAWTGSVAFGLLAMWLLDHDPSFPGRLIAVSAAVLCSLMCSSVGLAFVAAIGVELLLDPRRRRFLVALIVPIAAFAGWFLTLDTGGVPGSPGVSGTLLHGATGWAYVGDLAAFVSVGLGASASGIFAGAVPGVVVLLILAGLIAFQWYRLGGIVSWQVGLAAGILFWFTLVGLGRVQFGSAAAALSRYVYVGVVFLLPLVAHAVRELPWRGLWRAALIVAFAIAIFGNITELRDLALSQKDFMKFQAAELQTVEVFRGAPDMAVNRTIDDSVMPTLLASDYLAATEELGSPVPRASIDTLRQMPPQAVDRVMVNLFGDALTVKLDRDRSRQGLPCRDIDSTAGSTIDFQIADGQSIMLQPSKGGQAILSLGLESPPVPNQLHQVQLLSATPAWVHLPDTGKPVIWQLRIETGAVGLVTVCGTAGFQFYETANNLYGADAASGTFNPGWSAVPDAAALGGHSAKAAGGTYVSFTNVAFGAPRIPFTGTYDVWYRVRVARADGATPEMRLGLWDRAGAWVGSTEYRANQVGTDYRWLKVAAGITPVPGHEVVFLASVKDSLGTDWYVDEAVMLSVGASPPAA